MSQRPELLFPLFSDLTGLPGIGKKTADLLGHMDVEKPRDLIFTLPHGVIDRRPIATVLDAVPPATVTVEIEVGRHIPARQKGRPSRVEVTDAGTTFQLVFFHAGGDWLDKQLPTGHRRVVSGKIEVFDGVYQMVHPEYIVTPDLSASIPEFEAVYPLTAGVSLKVMTRAAHAALELAPDLDEWADAALVKREGWAPWLQALRAAHEPKESGDLAATHPNLQRLAYDELFAHQLTLALARSLARRKPGRQTRGTGTLRNKVLQQLPYHPTAAQLRSVGEIEADMGASHRMNRLLQGDVGSGKTLVAFLALLVAVEAGGQGVLMSPTEILARQHLDGLRPLAEKAGVVLEVLTGRDKGRERLAKLKALEKGDIHILVGTHAVFQQDVVFGDLRLAIVDEQHRFGVAQRMALGAKGQAVDVLVMTATPIPRSLSLAQYGDMDLSVLDEKPPGRKPVTTAVVSAGRIGEVIDRLQKSVIDGRQAYWVCPLVEESEVVEKTAAEERFKHLRAAFGEGVVGLVHGQMPASEKDAAMAAFVAGDTRVLVATTVIEVGVDVPNASIMVIEGAEGFGLAQLHQLRGRVGRGSDHSTCILLYQGPLSDSAERRLAIMRETEDGFRIAEEDLVLRGAGDVIGTAQSGLPRFRIADIERQANLMAMAQKDARKLLTDDPDLRLTERGQAARILLWLMEQDQAIRLIKVG